MLSFCRGVIRLCLVVLIVFCPVVRLLPFYVSEFEFLQKTNHGRDVNHVV